MTSLATDVEDPYEDDSPETLPQDEWQEDVTVTPPPEYGQPDCS
jgi:hypothetical protein